MKVLRILRRRKIRLSFIFLLLLIFIFNTYAWMSKDRDTFMGDIEVNVDEWSLAFIADGEEEIKTEEYTFEIDEFYPGITDEESGPIQKTIDVYNIGEAGTNLKYEITEVYLYGQQLLKIEQGEGEEATSIPETIGPETTDESTGLTTAYFFENEEATIFDAENENYKLSFLEEDDENYIFSLRYPTPFKISYTYEKTYIAGKNEEDTAKSKSWMKINLEWEHLDSNNEEDTRLGNLVYDFENAKDENGNLINEGEPALRIVAKVTAEREIK